MAGWPLACVKIGPDLVAATVCCTGQESLCSSGIHQTGDPEQAEIVLCRMATHSIDGDDKLKEDSRRSRSRTAATSSIIDRAP